MPNLSVTVEELAGLGETDLGWSSWFPVEQPRVDGFADATEDHQWIQLYPQRAGAGPFGPPMSPRYLTLSLVPHLLEDLLTISDQQRGTPSRLDRLRST